MKTQEYFSRRAHEKYLPISIFFISNSLGIIGQPISIYYFFLGFLSILYLPSLIRCLTKKNINNPNLQFLLNESKNFRRILSFVAGMGLVSGIFQNIFYEYAPNIFGISLLVAFFVLTKDTYKILHNLTRGD